MKDILGRLDKVLDDSLLLSEPRAVLLIRVCQILRVVEPGHFEKYLEKLKAIQSKIPEEKKDDFKALKGFDAVNRKKKSGGFALGIIERIEEGIKTAETSPADAEKIFTECEEKLKSRFWPFGKKTAWTALVDAWSKQNRQKALLNLKRIPSEMKKTLLIGMNSEKFLTTAEWELVGKNLGWMGNLNHIIIDILDDPGKELAIPGKLARSVANHLLIEIYPVRSDQDGQNAQPDEKAMKKAYNRHLSLINALFATNKELAKTLLMLWLSHVYTTKHFEQSWLGRFNELRGLINTWAVNPEFKEPILRSIKEKAPDHLRDFCISQCLAIYIKDESEIQGIWKELHNSVKNIAVSETWFLIIMIRNNYISKAFELARSSSHKQYILSKLNRALLFEKGEIAASIIPEEEIDDPIAVFLRLETVEKRIDWFREKTSKGLKLPPSEMFRSLNIVQVVDAINNDEPYKKGNSYPALPGFYSRETEKGKQFNHFIRIHGYGQYTTDDIDPFILQTLIAWNNKYPSEVETLLNKMWTEIEPDNNVITNDLMRNYVLGRAKILFAARPKSFHSLFINWLKRELVDKTVRNQVGNMIYTFSLNANAPFLYSLMSAEKVSPYSKQNADEIIAIAINSYETSDEFIRIAGSIYEPGKNFGAIKPPATLKKSAQMNAWQIGVVQSLADYIARELILGMQEK